jgi:hypothetical protein
MKLPRYELKAEKSLMVYEFISEGLSHVRQAKT